MREIAGANARVHTGNVPFLLSGTQNPTIDFGTISKFCGAFIFKYYVWKICIHFSTNIDVFSFKCLSEK